MFFTGILYTVIFRDKCADFMVRELWHSLIKFTIQLDKVKCGSD